MKSIVCNILLTGVMLTACTAVPIRYSEPTQSIQKYQTTSTSLPPTSVPEPTPTPTFQTRKSVYLDMLYNPDGNQSQRLSVYLPDEALEEPHQKFPTLFLVHGWSMSNDLPPQKEVINFVKEMGYASVTIDYRMGSGIDAPWAAVSDGACALAWVYANADTYGFDVDKLVAFGNSFGATIVSNLTLTNDTQLFMNDCLYQIPEEKPFRGVVILSGWIYGVSTGSGFSFGIDEQGGESSLEQQQLEQIKPSNWSIADGPPFLILHGEKDQRWKPVESETFAGLLKSFEIPVTYMLLPDTGHNTWSRDETIWQVPIKQFLVDVIDK